MPFNSDDHTVKAFLEPLPFLIAATILFFFVSKYFGGYLLICSISMLYKNQAAYLIAKHKTLDYVDARIVAAARAAAVHPPINPTAKDVPLSVAAPDFLDRNMVPKPPPNKVRPAIDPIFRELERSFEAERRKRRSKPPSS